MFVIQAPKNEDQENRDKVTVSGSLSSIDVFCHVEMDSVIKCVYVRSGCGNQYMDDNGITTRYEFASSDDCLNGFVHLVKLWKSKVNSSSMFSSVKPEVYALFGNDSDYELLPTSTCIVEKTSNSSVNNNADDDGNDSNEEEKEDKDVPKSKKAKKVTAKWETALTKQLNQIRNAKKAFNDSSNNFYSDIVDACSSFDDIIRELSCWYDDDSKRILSLDEGARKYDGSNVYTAKNDFFTLLHLMVFGGHNADVLTLIERGADVNAFTYASNDSIGDGWGETQFNLMTPLHIACASGNLDAAKSLLTHGASVHLRSGMHGSFVTAIHESDYYYSTNCNALHIAAEGGHNDVIKLLLDGPQSKSEYGNLFKVDVNEYFIDHYGNIQRNSNLKHLKRLLISIQSIVSKSKSLIKKTGAISAFKFAIESVQKQISNQFSDCLSDIANEKSKLVDSFEATKQSKLLAAANGKGFKKEFREERKTLLISIHLLFDKLKQKFIAIRDEVYEIDSKLDSKCYEGGDNKSFVTEVQLLLTSMGGVLENEIESFREKWNLSSGDINETCGVIEDFVDQTGYEIQKKDTADIIKDNMRNQLSCIDDVINFALCVVESDFFNIKINVEGPSSDMKSDFCTQAARNVYSTLFNILKQIKALKLMKPVKKSQYEACKNDLNYVPDEEQDALSFAFESDDEDDNGEEDADAMDCDNSDDEDTAESSSEYQELNDLEKLITNFQSSLLVPLDNFKDYIGNRKKSGAYDECVKFLVTLEFAVSEYQSYSNCTEEHAQKINQLIGKDHAWNISDINALGGSMELPCGEDSENEDIKFNALAYAIIYGHLETAKLLLSRGATLDNVGVKGGLGRKRLSEFIQELLDNNAK